MYFQLQKCIRAKPFIPEHDFAPLAILPSFIPVYDHPPPHPSMTMELLGEEEES
jgi:hypothetical protein